jgi:hypothetical protein
LGAAFVAQFVTSMAFAAVSVKVLAGGAAGALAAAAANLTAVRASGLLELLTAAGIIALACLLYATLGELDRPRALVAMGLWISEATLLAVGGLALYAIGVLAASSGVGAAASGAAAAATVAFGVYQYAFTAHMLFFCFGALGWYSLLYQSGIVPRWLAAWGFLGSLPLLVSMTLSLWDRNLSLGILPGLPYAPFELVIGVWLIVTAGRAISSQRASAHNAAAPARLGGALS